MARERPVRCDQLVDQYARLLLLSFFNPAVTRLRGVQRVTTLDKVQRVFGIARPPSAPSV